jgi:hypothetical protein
MEARNNMPVSVAEAAYAAALLDTKGSYSIIRLKKQSKSSYAAHLTFTTTNTILAGFMQRTFRARTVRQGTSYRVYWNYEQMREVIEVMLPYLKITKAQAELMLGFLKKSSPSAYCLDRMIELNARKRDQLQDETGSETTERDATDPPLPQEKEVVLVESNKQRSFQIWRHAQQIYSVKRGEIFRAQAGAPFDLKWSVNKSASIKVTRSAYAQVLSFHFVDIPISASEIGPLHFTFFWRDDNRWEGQDYTVAIV